MFVCLTWEKGNHFNFEHVEFGVSVEPWSGDVQRGSRAPTETGDSDFRVSQEAVIDAIRADNIAQAEHEELEEKRPKDTRFALCAWKELFIYLC